MGERYCVKINAPRLGVQKLIAVNGVTAQKRENGGTTSATWKNEQFATKEKMNDVYFVAPTTKSIL